MQGFNGILLTVGSNKVRSRAVINLPYARPEDFLSVCGAERNEMSTRGGRIVIVNTNMLSFWQVIGFVRIFLFVIPQRRGGNHYGLSDCAESR